MLLAGFETAAHWEDERHRYRELASSEDRTIAVASREPLTPVTGVQTFQLADDDPLAGHWFLLALTPMVSATLFARALVDEAGDEGSERPFLAVWTFDPSVARDIGSTLAGLARDASSVLEPLLAAEFECASPAPMTHSFGQRYSVATFERLEATRRGWRDLSVELEVARRELEERTERQLKLERLASIGTLAAAVAHELNNPLASITMAANVMGQLEDPEERLRMAGIIESEALRAGRIAGDLLAYVADRELELTTIRLDRWLEDLAAEYRMQGHHVELRDAAEVTLDVDRDRLRQAVSNLLDNAIDAIDRDGHVWIELAAAGDEVHISVADDGAGIPEQLRTKLFDPFITSKPRAQGTGLGLPIARAHLQDHHGDLELMDSGPAGSRFRIRLPRAIHPATPTDLRPTEEDDAPLAAPTAEGGGRVLVVDDEPPIRALLETLLRRSGWQVVSASGMHEAVRAVRDGPVDVALLDVQLGGYDGPTVLAELESTCPGLRLHSAYITGAPPESGLIDGRPVLAKPFSWDDLSELLARLQRG